MRVAASAVLGLLALSARQAESTAASSGDLSSIILPAKAGEGPAKLLLFLPAAPPETYVPLAKALQDRSPVRLAVGIAVCNNMIHIFNSSQCDPVMQAPKVLGDIIAKVNASEGNSLVPSDIIVGGHGIGGVVARYFVDNNYPAAAGVMLFGTQYNGDNDKILPWPFTMGGYLGYPEDIAAYPRPLLAVAGELDKLPISNLALMVQRWSAVSSASRHRVLPIIVPGLSDSGFCPDYHLPGDIVPEVSADEGRAAIVEVVGAWMDLVHSGFKDAQAETVLDRWSTLTAPIAAPFNAAIALDQEWCAKSQRALPGAPEDITVQVRHVGFAKLDSCHTEYAKQASGGLNVTLCDYSAYSYGNNPPWAASYAGAVDISCKMIGEDRLAQVMDLPIPDMSSPEIQNRCQEINKRAFEAAKSIVQAHWPKALARFQSQGKKVVFAEDSKTSAGPLWLLEGLKYQETDDQVEVSGTALISGLKSLIYPGNHYCKLLAPSKAVDLLMTMGLTQRYPYTAHTVDQLLV